MLFAGDGLGENPQFIGASRHSGRFAGFIADAGLEIPDCGVKQGRVDERTEHLEEEAVQQESSKTFPRDHLERTQKQQNGAGVDQLADDGRAVVSKPQVVPLCQFLPEMKDADVDELRLQVGDHRGEDSRGVEAENL